MKIRFHVTIAILFILAGCLVGSQLFLKPGSRTPQVASVSAEAAPTEEPIPAPINELVEGEPVHIEVKSVGVSVGIERGNYDYQNQTWEVSETKADFASMTALPNNKAGNTFIYGHNRKGVFEEMLKTQIGDRAVVTTSNGRRFIYALESSRDTNPRDVSLFSYQGAPILTVQTCSGARYEHRRLFTFTFVGVE